MPEQVPEIQEKIDRQRAEGTSSRRAVQDEADSAGEGWSVRRRLWILVVGSVAGFVALGIGQQWFFSRPRSMSTFSLLFPLGYVILNAFVVAGIVGIVVSVQFRRERRRNARVPEMESLVRLHARGAIDDEELVRALHDTLGNPDNP